MTPFEKDVLTFLSLRDAPVSWSEIRDQFTVSEGALTVAINSLKRKLLVAQDGTFYAPTSLGRDVLKPRPRRVAFGGKAAW